MTRLFTRIASAIARFVGNPVAFVIAIGCIIVWAVCGPIFGYTDTWQLIINTGTTIVTFLIVFLIQNSQNRDSAATQAKLDEIIRKLEGADNAFIGVEHLTATELRDLVARQEHETGQRKGDAD